MWNRLVSIRPVSDRNQKNAVLLCLSLASRATLVHRKANIALTSAAFGWLRGNGQGRLPHTMSFSLALHAALLLARESARLVHAVP